MFYTQKPFKAILLEPNLLSHFVLVADMHYFGSILIDAKILEVSDYKI
jgi:aspartate 1-decarboxylase